MQSMSSFLTRMIRFSSGGSVKAVGPIRLPRRVQFLGGLVWSDNG